MSRDASNSDMRTVRFCSRCDEEYDDSNTVLCRSCIVEIRDQEKHCSICDSLVPEPRSIFCSDECREEAMTDVDVDRSRCSSCDRRLPSSRGHLCRCCAASLPQEYRCVSCNTVFEGTRGDTPACDVCENLSETVVYLMETAGYVKIGISKCPEKRLAEIQSHTPQVVELVTTVQSEQPRQLEKALHELFEDCRTPTDREWFELSDEACRDLEDVNYLSPDEARSMFGDGGDWF